ncbi:MAG TPA: tyrosine--tRNA ligase [Ignavibacteriales bacterium]|nr:tyrosine--tRNA ligase [Ignavibacteriales bacterium]HPD66907.1 tyrosine--tRNA ligase [Ignavibacteriales bacterium]HRR18586.1 tyrosine--tRNA ligase [Ignavibacteriales bacterium]HRT98289.1 tyrosine--tRNA ligase [Ignavibacteriales bacterium]
MKHFPSVNEQMDLIKRGAVEIIPEVELVKKIENSIKNIKPLRIKLGCDPTRPDLHLGHSVVLRKLAQFQSLGHQAVLIIGDFTGMIGDPTGRNITRPSLTLEECRINAKTYIEQAAKILNIKDTEIVYNSDWLGNMKFEDVIKLAAKYTVARMLERDDFNNRFKAGIPISMHEILYPLAQGMDSVQIKSDVELGGTDQKFNLLVGRDLQREYGMEPQVILTMPLLVGTDGKEKMSKSYGNYIGLSDTPFDIYGKTLSIPDELIYTYYELTTDVSKDDLIEIKKQLEDKNVNPRDLKRRLARTLVEMYYDKQAAIEAEENFDKIFIIKDIPDDIPEFKIENQDINIVELLVKLNFASSKSEARRLIEQGGVSLAGEKITDFNTTVKIQNEQVLKVGKRKFIKLITN